MIRKNEMFIYILIALSILVTECKSKPVFKENRSEFKTGEIILPDYAHNDTLVVANGFKLNAAIDSVATDREIDSVLHLYCKPYKK